MTDSGRALETNEDILAMDRIQNDLMRDLVDLSLFLIYLWYP